MLDDNTSYDEFIRQTIREQSREEVLRRVKKTIWVTFQKEGIHKLTIVARTFTAATIVEPMSGLSITSRKKSVE